MNFDVLEIVPFKSTFFTGTFPENMTEGIIDEIKKIQKIDKGVTFSNQGGWQSKSYSSLSDNKFMYNLIINLTNLVNDVAKKYCIKNEMRLSNYWFNINKKYNYNVKHTHPFSQFSAVVYLKVPKDSGKFLFERTDGFVDYMRTAGELNEYSFSVWQIEPTENQFIIFPAYMLHSVTQNLANGDDERISIAFNFND